MKTVREVAFDLGVSKTRILKIINNLPKRKKPKFVGNKYLLNDENIFDISCFITNIESKRNDNLDTDFDNLVIENQQQVIEILKEQNKNKDLQIEQLQKLLENQQILSLNEQKEKQLLLESMKVSFWKKIKFFKKWEIRFNKGVSKLIGIKCKWMLVRTKES